MLLLWEEGSAYWQIGLAYAFVGIGVGLAGTPASHSLTGSVPVTRAGMASGTADLQRDLGGAIMQSIFGALLTAGYAAAVAATIASSPRRTQVSDRRQTSSRSRSPAPRRSRSSTRSTRARSPRRPSSRSSTGDDWAYAAGIVAVLLGAVLVFFLFPRRDAEQPLLESYAAEDAVPRSDATCAASTTR